MSWRFDIYVTYLLIAAWLFSSSFLLLSFGVPLGTHWNSPISLGSAVYPGGAVGRGQNLFIKGFSKEQQLFRLIGAYSPFLPIRPASIPPDRIVFLF
jgi:hypothetical protein